METKLTEKFPLEQIPFERRITKITASAFQDSRLTSVESLSEPAVSVVIPAFNEGKTLGSVIKRIRSTMKIFGIRHEIIVVDDGSRDDTASVGASLDVVVVRNGVNRGKGHALQLGFQRARGSLIVTMDADGSHQPEEIPKLLSPIISDNRQIEVVVGSRFSGGSDGSTTALHIVGNRIFNMGVYLLTGTMISDTQSGFRAYNRKVVQEMVLQSRDFGIDVEILVKALRNGSRLAEVPITCVAREHGNSKVHTFRDGFKILKIILQASFS